MESRVAPADDLGVDARRPPLLVTALLLASLFPAWALLRALDLSLYFEPTDVALYRAKVGHNLGASAAAVLVALLAVAVGIGWIRPLASTRLTAGVAVTISLGLALTGLAWVNAERALNPFGPELRALATFTPPPGAQPDYESRSASTHPEVTRRWRIGGTPQELCAPSVARLEGWADAGTVANVLPSYPESCFFRGRRGQHDVELIVSESVRDQSGTAVLSLRVRRR